MVGENTYQQFSINFCGVVLVENVSFETSVPLLSCHLLVVEGVSGNVSHTEQCRRFNVVGRGSVHSENT